MKGLGPIFITSLVVMAAAKAAAAALCVALLAGFVYALFVCPQHVIAIVGTFALIGLVETHPLACLGFAALAIVARVIREAIGNSSKNQNGTYSEHPYSYRSAERPLELTTVATHIADARRGHEATE